MDVATMLAVRHGNAPGLQCFLLSRKPRLVIIASGFVSVSISFHFLACCLSCKTLS